MRLDNDWIVNFELVNVIDIDNLLVLVKLDCDWERNKECFTIWMGFFSVSSSCFVHT